MNFSREESNTLNFKLIFNVKRIFRRAMFCSWRSKLWGLMFSKKKYLISFSIIMKVNLSSCVRSIFDRMSSMYKFSFQQWRTSFPNSKKMNIFAVDYFVFVRKLYPVPTMLANIVCLTIDKIIDSTKNNYFFQHSNVFPINIWKMINITYDFE